MEQTVGNCTSLNVENKPCVSMQYMTGLVMVDPDEVRTIFMVLFMVFEPIRLTAGYYGNLREEVRC